MRDLDPVVATKQSPVLTVRVEEGCCCIVRRMPELRSASVVREFSSGQTERAGVVEAYFVGGCRDYSAFEYCIRTPSKTHLKSLKASADASLDHARQTPEGNTGEAQNQ